MTGGRPGNVPACRAFERRHPAGAPGRKEKATSDDHLVIMPSPALVAVLMSREQEKGAPLTEAEVLDVRNTIECDMTPPDVVAKIAEARGYDEIDPENVWEEWTAIRPRLKL